MSWHNHNHESINVEKKKKDEIKFLTLQLVLQAESLAQRCRVRHDVPSAVRRRWSPDWHRLLYPGESPPPEAQTETLRWRHNGLDSISNHQPHDCLLNLLSRRRSKKTSKRCVTSLCAGNSPGTGELPAQMASNAENVSICWCHHECLLYNSHWNLNKMADILQTTFYKCILLTENFYILIKISLNFVPNCPGKSALMNWHPTGDTSLSEPMINDAIWCHDSKHWINFKFCSKVS